MNAYRHWTNAEKQFVLDHYQTSMTITQIANRIDRTAAQVSAWMSSQNIRKGPARIIGLNFCRPSPVAEPEPIITLRQPKRKNPIQHGRYIQAEPIDRNYVELRKRVYGTYNDGRRENARDLV